MQSPPKKMAAVSLATENAEAAAAMDSDCVSESDIETSIVGIKPSSLLHAEYPPLGDLPSLDIRYFHMYLLKYN